MAKMIKICDVIKDKYIVPDFQRDYTWEWKNLELVLDDIKEAYSKGKKTYILGPIVVKEKDGRKKLIDGQQRLTSLLIILKALGVEDNGFLGFENREHVVELFRNIEDNKGGNQTCMRIGQLYSQTQKYFELFDEGKKKEFSDYLLNNVGFFEKTLRTDNIPHAFEVLNAAGEQLKKEDIAKAKLIASMVKLKLSKESELLNYAWLCCYDIENSLDDKIKNKEKDIYKADNLSSLYRIMKDFISEDCECVKTSIIDVVDSVEKGKYYSKVIGGRITDFKTGEFSVPLTPYGLLDVALSDKNSLGKTIVEIVNISSGLDFKESTAFRVIKSLLLYRIAFDKYVVKRRKGEWNWFLPLDPDEKYKDRLIKAESMMAVSGPATSKEMVRIVKNAVYQSNNFTKLNETATAVIKEIEHYAIERIKVNNIISNLNEGTGTNHFVFHWLDYLLYLNPMNEIKDKAGIFNFVETTSVEHFMPQNPTVKSIENWKDELNNFGNLALITPSSNSRQNNSSPEEKANIAKNGKLESLKYELMMEIARKRGWSVNESSEHGEEMKKLLLSSLNCDFDL